MRVSSVAEPTCGSRATSSRSSSPGCTRGSSSKTSSPAPAISPASSAATSAASSTTGPRAVLTRWAVGFIARSSAAPIRWCVAGVRGQCSETTSDAVSSSPSSTTRAPRPSTTPGSGAERPASRISMPNAVARRAVARPIAPGPTMPRVLPRRPVPRSRGEVPLPRLPGAHPALGGAQAASRHQHQGHREVGRRVGEHPGGVGHDHAALGAGGDVDVVVPHDHVGDDPQTRPGGIQQLRVDPVDHHRDERVDAGHRREQLVSRHGAGTSR